MYKYKVLESSILFKKKPQPRLRQKLGNQWEKDCQIMIHPWTGGEIIE